MLIDTMTRRTFAAVLTIALVACSACGGADDSAGPTPSTPDDPQTSLLPGEVTGTVVDSHGAPIAGAKIWVRPALTTGLLTATTDANGRYDVQGIASIPYRAYAWQFVNYRGSKLCLRLASSSESDYDSFVPSHGVVRNFRWKLEGEIEANSGEFFGGDIRVFTPGTPSGSKLMITLTPDGPLVDGSAGRTITLDAGAADLLLTGIPVGVYKASAAFIDANGNRTELEVNRDGSGHPYSAQTTMDWKTEGSCVGSTGSGADRSFLWVHVPGSED